MFGTAAIIMRYNQSEFIQNNKGVVAIDNNADYIEVSNAVRLILDRFQEYSADAREIFERCFFYKNSNMLLSAIIGE